MARTTLDLSEFEDFARRAPDEVRKAARRSVFAEAHSILSDSQAIVPFEEGILSSSGRVDGPSTRGDIIEAVIGYGGPAKDYAIVQHENLNYQHAAGREAKYLEKPADEHARSFQQRLARDLRAAFRRFSR